MASQQFSGICASRISYVFLTFLIFAILSTLFKVNVDVGRYHLQFDNTYSWFRAKQVYYWYHVSSAADPDKQMQQQLK